MQSVLKLSESERKEILDSYNFIQKNLDFFVIRFYHYFLQTEAKSLFHKTEMNKQFVMFSKSLDLILSQILNPEELIKSLNQIANDHIKYGTLVSHTPYFIDSFMLALKEVYNEEGKESILDLWSVLLIDLMDHFNNEINKK